MSSNETLIISLGHSTFELKHSNPGNWWKCPFPGWEHYPGTPGVCIWEYFLFCAPGAFVMTKTYFMTGEPFGQLITQSNRCVQTTLWLPGACLGTVSACAWQVFCGLVTWGLVFKARNSWVSLCKFHPLPPGESAASCNPQLLPSCQIYLRNSGQHRPAQNSSGSALVKLPDDNRKINWEV